jgi:small conductance mechanosensitive channel
MSTEPTVLSLDSVSKGGISFTTLIQTEPAQQWAVGRELRFRIRRALEEHSIAIG